MGCLDEIALSLDEVEAMRLTDIEDLYQADAAQRMGVSRQTLGNILARAHKKVATALMEGKALRISIADGTIQHPCPATHPLPNSSKDGEIQ